ncbi:hypothetical protein [Kribbella jiaozuonensis]|nr:hypothetical protein [Kribbella jiaozuonensis]
MQQFGSWDIPARASASDPADTAETFVAVAPSPAAIAPAVTLPPETRIP